MYFKPVLTINVFFYLGQRQLQPSALINYLSMFNLVKSVCVTFKHKNSKLSYPTVRLESNILEYISQTKYLGFMFNTNAQDDEDMLRQVHTLYIRSNNLLRTFHYCSTDVKLKLFKSYSTSFYCCYLWTAYKK